MRQIKFRAYHKADGMIYFGTHDFHITFEGKMYSNSAIRGQEDVNLLECGYTLMQFTGLLDKNGKEIWEGDILKGATYLGEVLWRGDDYAGFAIKANDGFYYVGNWKDPSAIIPEVLGNIYENPTLLTTKE